MSRVRRPQAMMDDDEYGYGAGYDDDVVRAAPRRRVAAYDPYDDDEDGYDRSGRHAGARDGRATRGGAVGGIGLAILAFTLRHPVPVIGGGTALALFGAITLNATAYQPGHHPAPLFETRPYADAGTTAATPQPRPKPSDSVATAGEPPLLTASLGTPQPRLKPVTSGEPSLIIRDLQALMAARGLYRGDIDGVPGPGTADAIRALERSLGLVETGEASERLLAHARDRDRAQPGSIATAPDPAAGQSAPRPPQTAPIPLASIAPQPAPGTMAVPVGLPAMAAPTANRVAPTKPPLAKPAADGKTQAVTRPAGQRAVPVVPQARSVAAATGSDARLARVQQGLSAIGFGPLRSDGVLDDNTVAAIRRYEIHRGWEPTGRLSDRLTLDLLMKSANR